MVLMMSSRCNALCNNNYEKDAEIDDDNNDNNGNNNNKDNKRFRIYCKKIKIKDPT